MAIDWEKGFTTGNVARRVLYRCGMDDDLLIFLEARDAPYCFRCLTQAFPGVNVRERLQSAERAGAPLLIGDGRCAICALTTTVVAWVPGDPDLLRQSRGRR